MKRKKVKVMPTTEELLQQILEEIQGLREDMYELLGEEEEGEEIPEEESAEELDAKVNWEG